MWTSLCGSVHLRVNYLMNVDMVMIRCQKSLPYHGSTSSFDVFNVSHSSVETSYFTFVLLCVSVCAQMSKTVIQTPSNIHSLDLVRKYQSDSYCQYEKYLIILLTSILFCVCFEGICSGDRPTTSPLLQKNFPMERYIYLFKGITWCLALQQCTVFVSSQLDCICTQKFK